MSKKSRKKQAKKAEFIGKVIGYIILAILSPLLGVAIAIYFVYRELIFRKKTFTMKMTLWKEKRKMKRFARLVRFNLGRIEEMLKEDFKEKYKDKGEEYINNLSFVVSRKTIIDGKLPNHYQSFYENEKKISSTETTKAIRKTNVRELHLQNLLLQTYIFKFNKKILGKYFKKAKAIDKTAKRLTDDEAAKIYVELRQLEKSRRIYKEIAEAPKIDIKLEYAKLFIMLATILFLSTGVFYNHLFLGYFNIELSKFFSLDDYIATSIDKIYFTLTSMIIGLGIGIFFGQSRYRGTKGIYDFDFYFFLTIAVLATIIGFYLDMGDKYFYLFIVLIILYTNFSVKIILKYFKQPLQVYIFALIIFLFLGLIWASSMKDRHAIVKDELDKIKKYTIVFEEEFPLSEKNLILLASTSKYYFFYDKMTKKIHIIPFHLVHSIESKMN